MKRNMWGGTLQVIHARTIDQDVFVQSLSKEGLNTSLLTDFPKIIRMQLDMLTKNDSRSFSIRLNIFESGTENVKPLKKLSLNRESKTGIPGLNYLVGMAYGNDDDRKSFVKKIYRENYDPNNFLALPDMVALYIDGVLNDNFGRFTFALHIFEEGQKPVPPVSDSPHTPA